MRKPDLLLLRTAFLVRRYHTVPLMVKEETVGQHTVGVIALLFHLYDGKPPIEVIRYALHHDVAEAVTGDVPATAKWRFPKIGEALRDAELEIARAEGLETEGDNALFKFADMMDLIFKCMEEMGMGNVTVSPILQRGLKVCSDLIAGPLKTHIIAQEVWSMVFANEFINIQEVIRDGEGQPRH